MSRTTYAALFGIIGTAFGAGDGSTTFNVPDPQGRTLVIAGSGSLAESVAASAVTVAADTITVQSNADRWITGMKVRATTTGALPTGLAINTDYFVIRVDATTIKLASSLTNALSGTAIDITAQGSGTHTLTHTLTMRAMGAKGGEEAHSDTVAEMPSHRHRALGNNASGSNIVTGLADAGSRAIAGNTNTQNVTYTDTNNGNALIENTGSGNAHNNMPPFLAAGNLFIYAGV